MPSPGCVTTLSVGVEVSTGVTTIGAGVGVTSGATALGVGEGVTSGTGTPEPIRDCPTRALFGPFLSK